MIKIFILLFGFIFSLFCLADDKLCQHGEDTAGLTNSHPLCIFRAGQNDFHNGNYNDARVKWKTLLTMDSIPQEFSIYKLHARENLGYLYFYGIGMKENLFLGLEYWHEATSLGGQEADKYLCFAYANSDTIIFSFRKTHVHCSKAESIYEKRISTKKIEDILAKIRKNKAFAENELDKYKTEKQMIKADEKARIHFHQQLRKDLREKMPKETNSYSELLAYIDQQDKIAGDYGIKSKRGVVNWVVLALSSGNDFYQKPEVKNYFKLPGKPNAETRLSILVDYLIVKKKNPAIKIDTIFADHGYHIRRNKGSANNAASSR